MPFRFGKPMGDASLSSLSGSATGVSFKIAFLYSGELQPPPAPWLAHP